MADGVEESAGEDGDHKGFRHGLDAFAAFGEHLEDGHIVGEATGGDGEYGADKEEEQDVEASDGASENQEVGKGGHDIAEGNGGGGGKGGVILAREEVDDEGDGGGRQHHFEVHDELIAHGNPLGSRGGDGGVGDHGHVVAEHRTANNGACHEADVEVHRLYQACGNGHYGGNRATTRADG